MANKLTREERDIENNLHKVIGKSLLTPAKKREIQRAARVALERKRKTERVTLRLEAGTIRGLRAQADRAGLRYQTLASAVLKQVASGNLEMRTVHVKAPAPQ